ncbi:MAG: CPBP family intramembrane metalloprotease [Oscillospiraceae bacterium]|nr:CPBP family intramembrane metalloprotease [Oscillospiraceae bacterium]
MAYYEEQHGAYPGEEPRGTVYQAGSGFYNPYVEPLWKKEKRAIRGAGNGIGLAALGYIVISFAASLVFEILIMLMYPAANIHGLLYVTEATEWTFTLIAYVLSLIIPFGIYALCTKMPFRVAVPIKKAKFDLTFGGVLIGLGGGVIASYATGYLQVALESIGIGITMPEYELPETVPGIILYVIAMTVAPAFIEEIAFRGIVMQNLRRVGDIFALVSSALIFGIFHLNLIQMPYAFILGLCIGYFVMRTGSLWVGIILHFINNGVAVIFEFAEPYISENTYLMANLVYNLVCVILAVIALACVLVKYKDMFRFEKSRTLLSSVKKTLYFITSPALIIAMIAAVFLTMPYIEFLWL